jgi:hypothetical protein
MTLPQVLQRGFFRTARPLDLDDSDESFFTRPIPSCARVRGLLNLRRRCDRSAQKGDQGLLGARPEGVHNVRQGLVQRRRRRCLREADHSEGASGAVDRCNEESEILAGHVGRTTVP